MNPQDDPQLLHLKAPPHSTEAEQSLIGALLIDNSAFDKVAFLHEAAFYEDRHRRLWRCLTKLIEAEKVADLVTVPDALGEERGRVGGTAYIAELVQNTPSALNIVRYAELVREKAVLRELAAAATDIGELALNGATQDVARALDEAEGRVLRIGEQLQRHSKGTDLQGLLASAFERVDHLYHQQNKSAVTGVATGFCDLDEKTAGLQPGDLVIVAGRPSMGKTAFALNIVEHAALDCGLPVAVFSMEMSGQQLAMRLLASVARVDQHRLRTGRLNDEEWSSLSTAMGKLHDAKVEIDETGALTALELRARARRMRKKFGGLGLVVVDYLQLMEAPGKGENRATDVAQISRSLKAMAKELKCPVVALSQLSRKVEERGDKRPMMSDLRESGAIEQDADVILFLYRHEVYYPDVPEAAGVAELIIGKQRQGMIGKVMLTFLGQYTRFESYAGAARSFRAPPKSAAKNFYDTDRAA